LGQLLNHSSGLDYGVDGTTPMSGATRAMPVAYSHSYKEGEDVTTFFKILKGSLSGVPLRFEPGTNFAYGFSSDCAGFIVERLSGKSLDQYFQDHIFGPLGIKSASFYLTPPLKDRLLPLSYRTKSGTVERWNATPVVDQDPAHVRVHLGGVGLYASQKDYLAVLRHLLQIKAGSAANPIVSRASVDTMYDRAAPRPPRRRRAVRPRSPREHSGYPGKAQERFRGLGWVGNDEPLRRPYDWRSGSVCHSACSRRRRQA